ncbi:MULTISPECIES: hypothetical protein [Actinomycetes]|uniref:Uncharacterized protein n=2 Tax=Nocardia TaxID=1817 RepID=A0A4R6PN65_NOCIG|nr:MULTISPECIES: hypothetical protein [Nocardia]MCA2209512.1 hypothetical protein [Nocardia rosealba]NKX89152.1 hypothetical protein [Nocardia coubleae]TDP39329.1 hypothetical protein DFR75_10240 [Nocardia ignorata]
MRIKTTIAAALLALATVAGVSTVTAGTAAAAAPEGTYYGTYYELYQCRADGESSYTGGYYWQCVETWEGWDLYIWY